MASSEPRPRTILITGATDGIGLLLAKSYASRGHKVLATGRRVIADDQQFFSSDDITYVTADQKNPKTAAQTIAAAMLDMDWTKLDLAILNGAMGWTGNPQDEPSENIRQQIDVNFTAPIFLTQALAPWLFVDGGKLVFIGSTVIFKGNGQFATYAATKAGLAGFARSLSSEWMGRATVSIIHPGPVRTSMHAKAGLKLGMVRRFFASPRKTADAIEYSIRRGDHKRLLTRGFRWRSTFSRKREGQL